MGGSLRKIFLSKTAGNIALLLIALLGVYFFVYREGRFFRIPSASMEPTLFPVDMIVTMADDSYKRGDIVVLREPSNPSEYFVKRIVAVAGDRVAVHQGALHLNEEYASEPYIMEPMAYEIRKPVLVPMDQVFVLGDNRNNSDDSHVNSECFPVDIIVGRVRFIYYPYDRLGPVSSYPLLNRLGQ